MLIYHTFKYGKKLYTLKGLVYPIALLEHPFHANRVLLAVALISYYLLVMSIQPGILFFDFTDMDYAIRQTCSEGVLFV